MHRPAHRTRRVAKDAETGRFISMEEAARRHDTAYTMSVRLPERRREAL